MLISFYYRIGDFTVALWMFEAFEEESYQGRLGEGENSRNTRYIKTELYLVRRKSLVDGCIEIEVSAIFSLNKFEKC